MNVDIRVVSESDAEAFSKLRLRALEEEPESFGAAAHEEYAGMSLADIAKRLQSSDDSFILGAFAPHLVGMLGFYRSRGMKLRHKGNIWGMYVAPESRGNGFGRALMQQAILRASRVCDLELLLLSVVISNKTARGLYLSMGFNSYGIERAALKLENKYLDEDLMVLKLNNSNLK
jgi:ribosomal protein S18 acetylase RimI-like enzyme